MAMELLGLSKFKLQLLALIAEARDIRGRERSAREELQLSIQIEAEYTRKLQELQAEIASHEESQRRLEDKVKYVETEKDLLKKKEKELKETINSLLQSREAFLSHYEDSTYQLKQSIQKRDRKLVLLTEKIHTQIQLFDSMEKEAAAIKQVVNTVEDTVNGKEQEGLFLIKPYFARLKRKVDQISTLEKDFVEKILHLEKKLSNYQLELRRRDATINELEEKLEAAKFTNNFQPQIEEISR
ncbi:uncharacterized protein LOC135583503 isoform X3 [Musa acuminata AAA Group]|uniref:uncharacterized protein LOC135583503 isoform X3 n=1 Tax=Musa acuminata AAA Group TaxID=214697 RepID=UPI0031D2D3C7